MEIIDCPYCTTFALREPKTEKEQSQIKELLTYHCKREHIGDIVWEIVEQKIKDKLLY